MGEYALDRDSHLGVVRLSLTTLIVSVVAWSYLQFGPTPPSTPMMGGQLAGQKSNESGAKPGQQPVPAQIKGSYAPDVVIVAFHNNTPWMVRQVKASDYGLVEDSSVRSPYFNRFFIGRDPRSAGMSVEDAIRVLERDPAIRFAEADMRITPDQNLPNDPRFGDMWGLHNTGQSGGTFDVDIDAPEAWDTVGTLPDTIVGLMDDGVQLNHPDLAGNLFVNPGEIPGNGIDDDGNGFVDDVMGWDFSSGDNNPSPAGGDSHGTHTAGTIAAVTNNGVGVAGVARNVRLLPIRIYGGTNPWMSALVQGIDYARNMGAKVVSVSYNIDGYTQALSEAIGRADAGDMVYVNSAGNNAQNADGLRGALRNVHQNVVFVAATDRNDNMASFSNFGMTVDIAAPGVDVLSTVTGSGYDFYSGTSMACPHMAGAVAVIRSRYPHLSDRQSLDRLIGTADMTSQTQGRIAGGRLNLNNALDDDTTPPSDPTNLRLLAKATASLKIGFNGSGDDGTAGQASNYDIRFSASPIHIGNWEQATRHYVAIPPVNHGVPIEVELPVPPRTSLYVAVRALDNLGNPSGIISAGPFFGAPVVFDNAELRSWFTPITGPWQRTTERASSGIRSWSDSPGGSYANNLNIELRSGLVRFYNSGLVTPPASNYALAFRVNYDLESNYDYLYYDFSPNGTNWTNLGRVTGSSGGWKTVSAALPGSTTQGYIRFRMTSDSSVVRDGVYIDDVMFQPLQVIHEDSMTNPGNWTAQSPWALTSANFYSSPSSWTDSPAGQYANNMSINLTQVGTMDVSAYGNVQVTFRAYISTESGYDFLRVLTSLNGGSYQEKGRWSGSLASWNLYSVPVGGAGALSVRFNFSSDGSVLGDGVYVDDLRIVGEPYILVP